MKKKNELVIFEQFRLKPEDVRDEPPKKNDLCEIDDVYFYYNSKLKKKIENLFYIFFQF